MKMPNGWNEAKILKTSATLTGWPIEVKEVDGEIVSQILRHGWIYDYVYGNMVDFEDLKPTPHNIAKELGI